MQFSRQEYWSGLPFPSPGDLPELLSRSSLTQVSSSAHVHYVLSRLSRVRLFLTPWTVACQAPLSMGFSRQESWRGLPCPSPGDLPDPGIQPTSLMSPALLAFLYRRATGRAQKALIEMLPPASPEQGFITVYGNR